jgi:hypothetical protein
MKFRGVLALVLGVLTLLIGLSVWQWSGSNIAIQIGGSQNTIDQKTEPHLTSARAK